MFLNIENEKIVGGDHSIRNGKEATVPDFAEEINYELIKRTPARQRTCIFLLTE